MMHIFIFSPTALVRGNPARAKFAAESHVDTLVMVVLHCCYLITHGDIYKLGQHPGGGGGGGGGGGVLEFITGG